jgi:hypothetical protein
VKSKRLFEHLFTLFGDSKTVPQSSSFESRNSQTELGSVRAQRLVYCSEIKS